MKATELMIEDWVYCYGKPTKIAILTNGEVIATKIEDGVITPIPLTTEILEKNEFHLELSSNEKTLYSCILGTEDRCLVIFLLIDNEKWKLDIKNYYLKKYINFISFHNTLYVHEFQHALRLCGSSELADNFKV